MSDTAVFLFLVFDSGEIPFKLLTEGLRLRCHVYLHTPAADSLTNETNGRHTMSLLPLCGLLHWSMIFPPLLFCLDSDSSNDALISALWCNSSTSSLPRRRTGVITQRGCPTCLNEGRRAASTLVTASTGLKNTWYPLHTSSTLRVLKTSCRTWSHCVNPSCSLETTWR